LKPEALLESQYTQVKIEIVFYGYFLLKESYWLRTNTTAKKIGSLNLDKSPVIYVSKDTHLLHMLSMFQEKSSSLCVVVDKEKKAELQSGGKPRFADLTSKRDFYHDQTVEPQNV